ncbi:MAG: hypothetical protein GXP62_11195 [Oligoflexia bacterium]|nr:hypothetical protein [Oligoflexia bacterium]
MSPPMTLDDLDLLREGWDFEAKLAQGRDGQGQLPRSFWETYSAMANANGGQVVLGLKENADGSLDVRGLANPAKVERDLWNTLENRNKVSVNLLEARHVRVENLGGAQVLIIQIPRAARQDRPVHLNDDLLGQTYIRVHEGDHRVTDRDRVRRMLADAISDTRDDRVLSKYDEHDLDADTLRAYRNRFASHRVDHPWIDLDNRDFLRQLGAWGRDRETGAQGLTLAGLLMFGQHHSIRQVLPNYFPDYQMVRQLDDTDWEDRVWPDGTWSGNLFDTYRRVIQRLTADLKIPFRLDADLFRVHETHVHKAVR